MVNPQLVFIIFFLNLGNTVVLVPDTTYCALIVEEFSTEGCNWRYMAKYLC